jgi:hypothetical protein
MEKQKKLLTVNGNLHHHIFFLAVGLFLLLSFSPSASATMIGAWDIQSAPTSASMLSGTTSGHINGWLNTVNAPITINDALSGPNILDAGIANLYNSSFELTFGSGSVLNNAGADLVLFDARYDAGAYAISSSYDGFSNILSLAPSAFINTGESRSYYLEGCPYPTSFSAIIYGAAIDLSLLGIPDGADVTSFRIWSLNGTRSDFIGMGSLSSPSMQNPEPATMLLFGAGLAGFGVFRKKFTK